MIKYQGEETKELLLSGRKTIHTSARELKDGYRVLYEEAESFPPYKKTCAFYKTKGSYDKLACERIAAPLTGETWISLYPKNWRTEPIINLTERGPEAEVGTSTRPAKEEEVERAVLQALRTIILFELEFQTGIYKQTIKELKNHITKNQVSILELDLELKEGRL